MCFKIRDIGILKNSEGRMEYHITYPCFIIFYPKGEPLCLTGRVAADDSAPLEKCLLFFTDLPAATSYVYEAYRKNVPNGITYWLYKNRDMLVRDIKRVEPQLATIGVIHVVLDPAPNKSVIVATINEFIRMLEQQEQ